MRDEVVFVFTNESSDLVERNKGTERWRLNVGRASKCEFVALCKNAPMEESHRSAFKIGKVQGLIDVGAGRYKILVQQWARLPEPIPNIWPTNLRNPVRYGSLDELKLSRENLSFESGETEPEQGLSIDEAKAGLAIRYGCSEQEIDIFLPERVRTVMRQLHLLNRYEGGRLKNLGIDHDTGFFTSGVWKFRMSEAKTLIGGKIYLHTAKKNNSEMGGTVVDVRPAAEEGRVVFVFIPEAAGKNVEWQGQNHGMAWNSGIIER